MNKVQLKVLRRENRIPDKGEIRLRRLQRLCNQIHTYIYSIREGEKISIKIRDRKSNNKGLRLLKVRGPDCERSRTPRLGIRQIKSNGIDRLDKFRRNGSAENMPLDNHVITEPRLDRAYISKTQNMSITNGRLCPTNDSLQTSALSFPPSSTQHPKTLAQKIKTNKTLKLLNQQYMT